MIPRKRVKKAKYKHLKFKNEDIFKKWLEKHSAYKITFNDFDFDPTVWHIDYRGEVIHSDLQGAVWNGQIVIVEELKRGNVIFQDGRKLNHKCKLVRERITR